MKSVFFLSIVALLAAGPALAQTSIFRCGNAYTNDAQVAKAQGCKLMEGGNVTIVEGTKVNTAATVRVATTPNAAAQPQPQAGQKVESSEQKARDADARLILEAELKKAEARQVELQKEWNNGEPEKMGPEHRNHQKYLDRVAELKASMTRNEGDIAGIRRELGRLPGASAAVAK